MDEGSESQHESKETVLDVSRHGGRVPPWVVWVIGVPVYIYGAFLALQMLQLAVYVTEGSWALALVLLFTGFGVMPLFVAPGIVFFGYLFIVEWANESDNTWERWGKYFLGIAATTIGAWIAGALVAIIYLFLLQLVT